MHSFWSVNRGEDDMPLVTYGHRGVQRVGLLEQERVIDVNRAYAGLLYEFGLHIMHICALLREMSD
jgi:hypothetical protein